MKTVTKKELVHRIAEKTGVTKVVAKDVIQCFLDAIIDELAAGNRLEFREFGVFECRERAARRARNPKTNEEVEVPARRIVKFKVGRLMRAKVSEAEDAARDAAAKGGAPAVDGQAPAPGHDLMGQGGMQGESPA